MSPRPDPILEALLADQPVPPVPADLVERTIAAATALPQEPRPYKARRGAASRRDRRGGWPRRPLLIGSAAIGLVVSSAVAGTLAGVPLPAKVEAVLAELPLVGRKKIEPAPAPPPRRVAPAPKAEPVREVEAAPAPTTQEEFERARVVRRLIAARRIVAERRRVGLPTPVADRIERAVAAERNPALAAGDARGKGPLHRAAGRATARAARGPRGGARRDAQGDGGRSLAAAARGFA